MSVTHLIYETYVDNIGGYYASVRYFSPPPLDIIIFSALVYLSINKSVVVSLAVLTDYREIFRIGRISGVQITICFLLSGKPDYLISI